jgi:hypothetical protein
MVCSSSIPVKTGSLRPGCSAFPSLTEHRHFVTRSGDPLSHSVVALVTYSIAYDKNRASANGEGCMAHGAIQTRGSGPATSDRLLQALALPTGDGGHMPGLDASRQLAPVLVNASIWLYRGPVNFLVAVLSYL